MKFDKNCKSGNIIASHTSSYDHALEINGAKFLGVSFIDEIECHLWAIEEDNSPILQELTILQEELAQAYRRIEQLQGELEKQKRLKLDAMDCKLIGHASISGADSWKGSVDRQGGAFDEYEIAQRNWESGW